MMTGIDRISGPLLEILREREIIARCELLIRTYDVVREAKLNDQEAAEIRKMAGEKIAPGIFASIMSKEPIFFDLPKLDTFTQINGRIFHFLHTKKYNKQDFDNAYRKVQQSLPDLKIILLKTLVDLLKEFMDGAGYNLSEGTPDRLVFSAGDKHLFATVVTSIKALDMNKQKRRPEMDQTILVPSSESLEPFVQFYRENGKSAEEKGIQIWICNLEKGNIDPFIGYTTDLDIYNQFDNPRLAEMVRNNWGVKQ
jgi:hypothetical protein